MRVFAVVLLVVWAGLVQANPFQAERVNITKIADGFSGPWSVGFLPKGEMLVTEKRGRLWAHEHGAKGGDEINRIVKGHNYGWPVIAFGRHYSGAKIGEGTAKEGFKLPVFYWDPSIVPSGFAIHSGENWPEMRGKFIVGSLKFDMISLLSSGGRTEIARLKTRETQRVRDVRIGPEGGVWFLSEKQGALFRITPK